MNAETTARLSGVPSRSSTARRCDGCRSSARSRRAAERSAGTKTRMSSVRRSRAICRSSFRQTARALVMRRFPWHARPSPRRRGTRPRATGPRPRRSRPRCRAPGASAARSPAPARVAAAQHGVDGGPEEARLLHLRHLVEGAHRVDRPCRAHFHDRTPGEHLLHLGCRAERGQPSGMDQRDAVAALRFVEIVRRDEHGDARKPPACR